MKVFSGQKVGVLEELPSPDADPATLLGIPTLDPACQAHSLPRPVVKWGTVARTAPVPGGTVHFYTHDYKFSRLWHRPWQVPDAGYAVAVEPNYSILPDTPPVEAFHLIWRKRTLARSWQNAGVRVVVDLNLDAAGRYHEIGLLGVPRGWRAYAIRTHRGGTFDSTEAMHDLAVRHAGTDAILWVVFGGGRDVRDACRARRWAWVPEDSDRVRGREIAREWWP